MSLNRRFFPDFAANENLCEKLGNMIVSGTLSHAYILEGPKGFGKTTLAMELIAALACEHKASSGAVLPCKKCPSCQKILSKNSPDIRFINRDGKATLGIDAMRFLKEDVHVAPMELPVKVYIIPDAQTMTVQAQNAFLLTLEEPPEYVLFLLLCESAESLLETIRSRAPLYRLLPASHETTLQYLSKHTPEKARQFGQDELSQIIISSQGSIGRAMELMDSKSRKAIFERRAFTDAFVDCCLHNASSEEVVEVMRGFGSKRDEVCEQLLYISNAIRDLLLLKKSDDVPMLYYTDKEKAQSLSEQLTLPRLLSIWSSVEEIRQALLQNGNVALCLTQLGIKTQLLI